jgi:hypothetical protein
VPTNTENQAQDALDVALRTIVEREHTPAKSVHVNLVMDPEMYDVVTALREVPSMHLNQSDALRYLLDKGIRTMLAERTASE